MWIITQIYDGDFGCEGLAPGEKTKVSVTLKNDEGMKKLMSVEDAWLVEMALMLGMYGRVMPSKY